MVKLIQPSFAGGEISPGVAARIDLTKRAVAVERADNFIARVEGGMASRAGQKFVARAKSNNSVRIIGFEFNSDQTFIIELGGYYARFHSNGGQIVDAAVAVSNIVVTTVTTITTGAAHGLTTGDEVYLSGIVGVTGLNGRSVKAVVTGATEFTVNDLDGTPIVGAGTYTSGGSVYPVIEIVTPYAAADLGDLRFAQSGDVMTLCHPAYAPRELTRITNTSWALTEIELGPDQEEPTTLTATSDYAMTGTVGSVSAGNPIEITVGGSAYLGSGTSNHGVPTGTKVTFADMTTTVGTNLLNGEIFRVTSPDANTFLLDGTDGSAYVGGADTGTFSVTGDPIKYTVTAVNATTGQESRSGLATTYTLISGITNANPAVITTTTAHGLDYGDEFQLRYAAGLNEMNKRRFRVLSAPTTTSMTVMTLGSVAVDSTDYGVYTGSGRVIPAFVAVDRTAPKFENTISWTAVDDAASYNIYRQTVGEYVFIGVSNTNSFTDDFIDNDGVESVPTPFNPFEDGAGYWPATTGFFNQRQVYANSNTFPNRFWMTQVGGFYHFVQSSPLRDDDSIIGSISSQKINEIRHLLPLSDLLIMTAGAEYRVTGQGEAPFTPSSISLKPQSFYGSADLAPIVAGEGALFMTPGQAVRELTYEFAADKFTGMDLTVLARHLFDGHVISAWAYAPAPHSIVYCVRDDGVGLVLTYDKAQEVYSWSRITTDGLYKSVAVVREGAYDVPYFVVNRTVNGVAGNYIERGDERDFTHVEQAFCLDCGLSLDVPIAIASITVEDLTPTPSLTEKRLVVTTATAHGLSVGDTVSILGTKEAYAQATSGERASVNYDGTGLEVDAKTSTTIDVIVDISAADYPAYTSGGDVRLETDTVSGLWHLEGESISVVGSGYVETGLTVSGGSVTLSQPAGLIHAGLPYICQLVTLPIDTYNKGQSTSGTPKNVSSLGVQVERSLGMWTGPTESNMREAKFGAPSRWGQPLQMVSDIIEVGLKPDWDKRRQVVVQQRSPLPLSILALIPDVRTGK